jgi:hypothetical protein
VPFVGTSSAGTTYWENAKDTYTGLAFANPAGEPRTVRLELFVRNGGERRLEASLELPPEGQTAKLLTELFEDLPPEGHGVLRYSVAGGAGFLALRIRNTPRGDTLTSSLLFGRIDRDAGSLFPQIVDGGGYASRLVVMNPGDRTAEGSIHFHAGSGEPRRVLLRRP